MLRRTLSSIGPAGLTLACVLVVALIVTSADPRTRDRAAHAQPPSEEKRALADAVLFAPPDREDLSLVATASLEIDELVVRAGPSSDAAELNRLDIDPTYPLALLAVSSQDRLEHSDFISPHNGWLEVHLPVRPNGSTGWVNLDDVELEENPFVVSIDVSSRSMVVTKNGRTVMDVGIAVGTGETPTPIGTFYTLELLRPSDPDGAYGPFAFGLSGFSESLDSYNGGDAIIGIHGTNDPSSIGSEVSHGCIRVTNDHIEELVTFLPLGTPVRIVP